MFSFLILFSYFKGNLFSKRERYRIKYSIVFGVGNKLHSTNKPCNFGFLLNLFRYDKFYSLDAIWVGNILFRNISPLKKHRLTYELVLDQEILMYGHLEKFWKVGRTENFLYIAILNKIPNSFQFSIFNICRIFLSRRFCIVDLFGDVKK